MRKLILFLLAPIVVVFMLWLWPGYSQTVKRVDAYLLDDTGAPLANQAVIFEGTKTPTSFWWGWRVWQAHQGEKVKVVAVTDSKGFVQVVNMPPGTYTLKLVRPGEEPIPVKTFELDATYANYKVEEKVQFKEGFQFKESLRPEVLRKQPLESPPSKSPLPAPTGGEGVKPLKAN